MALYQSGSGLGALVGVGTTNPTSNLQVYGTPIAAGNVFSVLNTAASGNVAQFSSSAGTALIINSIGNVGIGTASARTSPRLWSANDVTLTTGNYAGDVACQIAAVGLTNPDKRLALMYDTTNNIGLVQAMIYGSGVSPLCLNAAGGNVGIGITNPGSALQVVGTVTATTFSGAGTSLTGTAASLTAGNATTAVNQSGGTVSATTGSFSGVITLPSGAGTNEIGPGTGDGGSLTTYNVYFKTWYGLAIRDYANTVRMVADARAGTWNTTGGYQINGTTVIDGSRNLTNIGTVGCGAITCTAITSSGDLSCSATNANLGLNRGAIWFNGVGDTNHYLYNNYNNRDGAGAFDGMKWNTYNGLWIRGGSSGANTGFFLNSSGNVGIGITNPGAVLTVVGGSSTPVVQIHDSSSGGPDYGATYGMVNLTRGADTVKAHVAFIRAGNFVWQMGYISGTNSLGMFPFNFSGSQGTPTMTWSGGNVGIGVTNPTKPLVVVRPGAGGANPAIMVGNNGSGSGLRFQTYDLAAQGDAYMGLGTDMSGSAFEHSIVFPDPTTSGYVGNSRMTFGKYNGTTYTTLMTLLNGGNLGIGTASPAYTLHVNGTLGVTGDSRQGGVVYMDGTKNTSRGIEWYYGANDRYGMCQDTNGATRIFTSTAYGAASVRLCGVTGTSTGNFNDYLVVTASNGFVGIGTTNPQQALDVVGNIRMNSYMLPYVQYGSASGDYYFVIDFGGATGGYHTYVITLRFNQTNVTGGNMYFYARDTATTQMSTYEYSETYFRAGQYSTSNSSVIAASNEQNTDGTSRLQIEQSIGAGGRCNYMFDTVYCWANVGQTRCISQGWFTGGNGQVRYITIYNNGGPGYLQTANWTIERFYTS